MSTNTNIVSSENGPTNNSFLRRGGSNDSKNNNVKFNFTGERERDSFSLPSFLFRNFDEHLERSCPLSSRGRIANFLPPPPSRRRRIMRWNPRVCFFLFSIRRLANNNKRGCFECYARQQSRRDSISSKQHVVNSFSSLATSIRHGNYFFPPPPLSIFFFPFPFLFFLFYFILFYFFLFLMDFACWQKDRFRKDREIDWNCSFKNPIRWKGRNERLLDF